MSKRVSLQLGSALRTKCRIIFRDRATVRADLFCGFGNGLRLTRRFINWGTAACAKFHSWLDYGSTVFAGDSVLRSRYFNFGHRCTTRITERRSSGHFGTALFTALNSLNILNLTPVCVNLALRFLDGRNPS